MKIGIIIVHWKNKKQISKCLDSIALIKTKTYQYQTILVDNASGDSLNEFTEKYPKIVIIRNSENLGFSGGYNIGIKHALTLKSDFVFILNDDTYVHPLILDNLFNTQKKYNAGIVSPKIYFAPHYEYHKKRYISNQLGKVIWFAGGKFDWVNLIGYHKGVDQVDVGQFNNEKEEDFATGAGMLIQRKVFEQIGLLDERYFLYYEDLDFSFRARLKGFKLLFSPQAIMWHSNAGSSSSGSALQDYYITRNRFLFTMQYSSFSKKLVMLGEGIRLLAYGRHWQKLGIIDYALKRYGKGSFK